MIILWPVAFIFISLPLIHAPSNRLLELATAGHPYLAGGFIFLVCGLLGETLKARTAKGLISPAGLFLLSFMWWLSGALSALLFPLINLGVNWSQALGLIPGGGYNLSGHPLSAMLSSFFFTTPFFTSLILNFLAIPLCVARRVILAAAAFTPHYFWPRAEASLNRAVKVINWAAFIKSEAWHSIIIRIPLMTLVIMMPEKYWLYLSGWLLIILIMIEDIGKRSLSGKREGVWGR